MLRPTMTAVIDDIELDNPGKIAGWLVLPALGLVISVVREGVQIWVLLRGVVAQPAAENLIGIAIGVPWLVFACLVAAFFFRKHRWTPYLYIALLAGYVAFSGLYLLMHLLVPEPETADAPKELMRAVVGAGVWVPYFLRSRRVKSTFVNSW
jgi:hypothetical protein